MEDAKTWLKCRHIKLQSLSRVLWQELAVHDSGMISAEGLRRLLLGLGIEPQRNGHPAEIMGCNSLALPWSFWRNTGALWCL